MQVTLLRENSDGSADFKFDLTAHEMEELVKFGILEAIKNAIKEGEKLTCEGEEIES